MYLGDSDTRKSWAVVLVSVVLVPVLVRGFLPVGFGDSKMFQHLSERRKPGVNATETISCLRSSRAMAKASRMTEVFTRS